MKRTRNLLIYGATGYTGKLVARTAKQQGLSPILAGRNEAKLRAVSGPLGFAFRAFDLLGEAKIDAALAEVDAVLHIAGPFSATSKPMVDACLRTGTHYVDITGEIDVFEALAARDGHAKKAGVMLLPGAGFDVVPSDCLAAHLKRRLPDATDLKLFIGGLNALSHGTAKSMVESVPLGARVRRDGRIVTVAGSREVDCDFGEGPTPTATIPWGDVSTAYYSTGIPNIEVCMAASLPIRIAGRMPGFVRKFIGTSFVQTIFKARIDRMAEGPSDEVLRTGRRIVVGVASNAKGASVQARLTTMQGYLLTARASVEIVRRVAMGEAKPGFQTPSLMFGPDFILQFEGSRREDLNA